jgi:hypothetical protein
VLEASATPVTLVLRLHEAPAATAVSADGRALAGLDAVALERSDTGWAVDGSTVVVKARGRRIEIR